MTIFFTVDKVLEPAAETAAFWEALSGETCPGCRKNLTNGETAAAGICTECYFLEVKDQP